MRKGNHYNGFSLLEVIVAMMILTIAMTSIFKLHGQTIMMSAKARFLTKAPLLAQAKLAEIEGQPFKDIGDDAGDFGDDHPNYQWTLSIEEIPTELFAEDNYHLVLLKIEITLDDEERYELQTYRFFSE